jgi:dihydrofolate synthase/folylpolyglutamate synthase
LTASLSPVLDRLLALETFGIKLGLDNIRHLCAALGHPERAFRSLHIAGTNGKGSVSAMTHASLHASGAVAGRYTSPHLSELAERFVVGDHPVNISRIEGSVAEVLGCADALLHAGVLAAPPTFFEATTAAAFELFRRAGVDLAVVEVGLGGRFDATNVITPLAGAITTIDFDHQQHLGATLGAIAFEKAGIIKPGMPVVIGKLGTEARDVIRRRAADQGATLIEATMDVEHQTEIIDGRARLTLATPSGSYGPVTLSLRGEHQVQNAIVAVRLLETAAARGVPVTSEAIEHGLATAEWPARLELLAIEEGRRVLLDAAHNPEGARALAAYLDRWHPERPPIVLGVMKDKNVADIARVLLPVVSRVIATAAPTSRAIAALDLAARLRDMGATDVLVEPDPARAIERAFEAADTVCVAGSIFLAGAVREGLRQRAILPESHAR